MLFRVGVGMSQGNREPGARWIFTMQEVVSRIEGDCARISIGMAPRHNSSEPVPRVRSTVTR